MIISNSSEIQTFLTITNKLLFCNIRRTGLHPLQILVCRLFSRTEQVQKWRNLPNTHQEGSLAGNAFRRASFTERILRCQIIPNTKVDRAELRTGLQLAFRIPGGQLSNGWSASGGGSGRRK
jgi:hypothetical protein